MFSGGAQLKYLKNLYQTVFFKLNIKRARGPIVLSEASCLINKAHFIWTYLASNSYSIYAKYVFLHAAYSLFNEFIRISPNFIQNNRPNVTSLGLLTLLRTSAVWNRIVWITLAIKPETDHLHMSHRRLFWKRPNTGLSRRKHESDTFKYIFFFGQVYTGAAIRSERTRVLR